MTEFSPVCIIRHFA